MRIVVWALAVAVLIAGCFRPSVTARPAPAAEQRVTLLVTNSGARHVSFVDTATGMIEQIEVGASPWGVALGPDGHAYISTAEGVAIVDIAARRRIALVPYRSTVGPVRFGEYRPGGMGIAVAPDGATVYVGVYLPSGPSRLEVLDVGRQVFVAEVAVGIRPFEVLLSGDGGTVFSIDHDSFSVTAVSVHDLSTQTLLVAPLGRGAYDKPHYAALDRSGRLLLPVQGRRLVTLDPASGWQELGVLTANTHQHGVAVTPNGRLLIVGTGPAGGASGPASLTIVDLETGREEVIRLTRPHEQVTVSPDGRTAYLTGGYLLAGGWDGLTVLDLETHQTREIPIPDLPLDVVVLPER